MNARNTVAVLLFALACGPSLPSRNPVALRREAVRQADRDLAAGKPKLFEAGTVAVGVVGLKPNDPLIRRLPHSRLPNGCTNKDAPLWTEYAGAYNRRVAESVNMRVRPNERLQRTRPAWQPHPNLATISRRGPGR